MSDREELQALRRLAELEAKSSRSISPDENLGGTLRFGPLNTPIGIPKSLEAGLVAAGKTFDRWGQGAKEAFYGLTGQDKAKAATQANVKQEDALYKPLADKYPVSAFIGEAAPYVGVGSLPVAAGLSALEPGTAGERATRAGLNYGLGKAGEYAMGGVARLFGPRSMAQQPAKATLADEFFPAPGSNPWNIPTTVGMNGSRPAQIAESVLANLPFTSGIVGKARDAAFSGFNREVANTFGQDSTRLTPRLLGAARKQIGGEIGDIARRNTFAMDAEFARDVARISQRAQTELTTAEADLIAGIGHKPGIITQILSKVGEDGTMPGTLYKAYDSMLGKMAKGNKGTIQDVLGDLRNAMRNAMDRSISDADSAAWKTARKEYANLMTVADAVKASPEGTLSPARLLQAVNTSQPNAKFGSGTDLAPLAQWGKTVLPDKIPNSGTAQREWYQRMLTNPLSGIAGAGGVMYGADHYGVDPMNAGAGMGAAYITARALAGKPLPPSAFDLLRRSGGLLGLGAANAWQASR